MASRDSSKPNIVFILSDDQGEWAMGCSGNSEIITPNLDRLAEEGIRFENFFCTSPVCSPARASILTGRMPSQHGIHDWIKAGSVDESWLPETVKAQKRYEHEHYPIEYLEGMTTYVDILKDNDYICGISGKWHLGHSMKPQKGFSYWNVMLRGGSNYYDTDMVEDSAYKEIDSYITDHITDNAIEFLEAQSENEQPFYLSIHYNAPHDPWGRENHPDKLFQMYDDINGSSCPYTTVHPDQVATDIVGDTKEKRLEIIKGYYAAITGMDLAIGRLIESLEQLALKENTLIIFTSDNGMNLGHHGIWGKGNGTFPQNMHDTSVKVPFIVSRPGFISEGIVDSHLLSHYDIMPTMLDYLSLDYTPSIPQPGRSFSRLLEGYKQPIRDCLMVCDEYGPVRMVRTKDYKYVHRYPYGPHEFYDLTVDPNEEVNMIGDPYYRSLIRAHKSKLEKFFYLHSLPELDGSKEAVTGSGQIEKAGLLNSGSANYEQDISLYNANFFILS